MKEVWKDVIGYEGLYEVSNKGRVRRGWIRSYRTLSGTLITVRIDHYGYSVVDLWKNNKQKRPRVHRLMYLAFVGPVPKGLIIRHLNDVKTDNILSNLKAGTYSENMHDSFKHGRHKYTDNAKLTPNQVLEIRRSSERNYILAKKYDVSDTTICDIRKRKSWKHI